MENIRNLDSENWVYWTQNVALYYFDLFKLTRDCFCLFFIIAPPIGGRCTEQHTKSTLAVSKVVMEAFLNQLKTNCILLLMCSAFVLGKLGRLEAIKYYCPFLH